MSPFFDDLERQLRDAARARAGSGAGAPSGAPAAGPPRWGRLRSGLRAAPVALAVGTTLAVVAAALVFLRHGGSAPSPAPPPQPSGAALATLLTGTPRAQLRREMGYISEAGRRVTASPGCRVDPQAGPRVVPGSPGQALLSTLGVFRRPATAVDRLGPQALTDVTEVYRGYIRRALVRGGVSYYLVATHDDPRLWSPTVACLHRELAALDRVLASVPASLRTPTRRLAAALVAADERAVATAPPDTLCIISVRRDGGGMDCGVTLAQVRAGQATEDNGLLTGIVPDGVATVTVHFPGGRRPDAHGRVVDNLFVVRVDTPGLPAGATVTWRGSDGRVVKTVAQPSARALAAYCRRHPASCAAMTASGGGDYSASSSSSASATATTAGSAAAPSAPATGG